IAMAISLWWVCLGQYDPYNRKNRVWLKNLSNQEHFCNFLPIEALRIVKQDEIFQYKQHHLAV
ncbi:MAG: hypothetical protein ABL857_04130, partial [Rickettsiales bacterium]